MGSVQRDNSACLESLEGFLQHVLQAPIIEGLLSIREQANEMALNTPSSMSDGLDEVHINTKLLKDVKNWSQVLLNEEVLRISQTIPYLQKLLTALFVMKVKVLSCINMRKDSGDFPLTIPANTTFIHHVYISCASVLLEHPSVLESMVVVDLIPLVREGIRKACFACIQWSELLAWGLDGVDVNDVVKSVMDDRQASEAAEDAQGGRSSDMDADGSNGDDDFHDLANNVKMTSGDVDDLSSDAKSDDDMDEMKDESFGGNEANEFGGAGDGGGGGTGANGGAFSSGMDDEQGSLFNFNDDSVSQAGGTNGNDNMGDGVSSADGMGSSARDSDGTSDMYSSNDGGMASHAADGASRSRPVLNSSTPPPRHQQLPTTHHAGAQHAGAGQSSPSRSPSFF